MTPPDKKKQRDLRLRATAERQIDDAQQVKGPLTPEPPRPPLDDLLHELQVHQIELEMQNEVLRQTQIDLEQSRDRYVDLFEFAPVGYVTLTTDGLIEELNLTGTTLLGAERKQLLHRQFTSLVIPEDQGRWMRMFLSAKESDRQGSAELALRRSDGTVFQAQLDCFHRAGGTPGVRVALTDITKRKQTEAELEQHRNHLEELVFARTSELTASRDEAEAANRAKSIFLANMSHELRTPMNGVMGMIDLALRRATDAKQIDWLNKSKVSAQHLLAVINDILDISKIESDRMTLEETNFSLVQAIDDTFQMQEGPAQSKGLSLSREIDPALPDRLSGDAMRLKQILLNFISNAIKFSEHGQITVRARSVNEDSRGVLLRIEVTDQGLGISPEQQARLFHAFTQVDGSMNRKYGGTGLGLIISKRIALLMGGDAGVISEEGLGSTFWATLKLKKSVTEIMASPMDRVDAGRQRTGGGNE